MSILETGNDRLAIVPPLSVQAVVDPNRNAARHSLSPIEWTGQGQTLGFYRVAQASGATVSLGALAHTAGFRWADATRFAVLLGIRVGYTVTGAITTQTPMDLRAIYARGFTVDFTTNNTQINMSTIAKSNSTRNTMGTSLMGTAGPNIATTAAMSGQTLTADTAPFAMVSFAGLTAVSATGTAVAAPVGQGAPMQDLYKFVPGVEYPIVLSANEGVIIQPVTAGPGTGSVKYYVEWSWCECVNF